MSVSENYYIIEFFDDAVNPRYEQFFAEDAYEAVAAFRESYPDKFFKIQNVAKILNLKESVYQ